MPQAEAAMNMKTAKEAAAKGCASIGNKDMRNATTAPANAIRSTLTAPRLAEGLAKEGCHDANQIRRLLRLPRSMTAGSQLPLTRR
jgi:hypothetical protein